MSSTNLPVVLLVQADHDDRDMYAEFLRYQGFVTVSVSTAAEALTAVARADVVVTGILIPGRIDGIELVTRLKGDERTKDIPVIVLTACVLQSDRDRAVAAGCDGFLAKPCLPGVLVDEIRRILTPRRMPKPRRVTEPLPAPRVRNN